MIKGERSKYNSYFCKKTTIMMQALIICSLLFLLQQKTSNAAPLPDCNDTCGGMEIPYPFGIREGCYLDETFRISCNEVTGSANLVWQNYKVNNISTLDHTFRHLDYVGLQLPFSRAGEAYVAYSSTFMGTAYSVSYTRNTFVAIGCDFFVYLVDEETSQVLGSCSSLCNLNDTTSSRQQQLLSCSGLNCCQISFPIDIMNSSVRVETMNSWVENGASRCGISSFIENDALHLIQINISSCNESYAFPIIHEWAVGNTTCSEATQRDDYLCGENTECINYTTGIGRYRCQCSNGYRGNPYLPQGCQDINECANPSDNNCPTENQCINTGGSYYCQPNRKQMLTLAIPLGVGLGVATLTLAAISIWTWQKLKALKIIKMRQKFFQKNGGLLLHQQISSTSGSLVPELTIFKIEELEKATDHFSKNRIIGKGGAGTVFKGMLSNGIIIAVKKANVMENQTEINQFINEVLILSQIHHRHIVKLYGCCLEAEIPLLVYEYVSNGTLSHHLHNHGGEESTFSWENRLRIVTEVADALAYLHSSATTAIFHRDIKSNNILLDQNYKAVLSDFGLSRSVSIDRTHLTTTVGGTFGYIDPQYFQTGRLNDKSDVYAFGVVVAEILTGEMAVSEDDLGLAQRFRSALKEDRLFEIVEMSVGYEGEKEEIIAVAKIANSCLKLKAEKRPNMKEVSSQLEHLREKKLQHGWGLDKLFE